MRSSGPSGPRREKHHWTAIPKVRALRARNLRMRWRLRRHLVNITANVGIYRLFEKLEICWGASLTQVFDVGMLSYGPGAPTPGPALSAGTGPSGRRGEDSAQQRDSLGSGLNISKVYANMLG